MNKFIRIVLLCVIPCTFSIAAAHGQSAARSGPPTFELRDGDRVALVGDTLIEREQRYGHIERLLTAHFPKAHVTFRNLGWSADTPQGQSRVSFDWHKSPDYWFSNLTNQIGTIAPTVVILGYGMANSLEPDSSVAQFAEHLNRLVNAILQINPATRLLFLGPIRHEELGSPLPNPASHNLKLQEYTHAIAETAKEHGAWFVPLFDLLGDGTKNAPGKPYTDNGIHLTPYGYEQAAQAIERGLGWEPLSLDSEQAEALRKAIVEKNELFFHRWRPQNSTYLFLFRKHEQGQNAKEIPMFDPLIEQAEARIAQLRSLRPTAAMTSLRPTKPDPDKITPLPHPAFQTDPNVEITLFAENPLLGKPIQMNFDPEGRLWVVSSFVYPQIEPGQKANDKVLVLEDTDSDGKADRSTVFAEGLLIPTGIEPGDGGAYVGHSTELLHLKDTDGDLKADQERIVLSAFGTEDTHHILHTLRWGYDGQLYMNQSIYIHSHIETPHGVVRLNSGGIFNFRPDTMELGVILKGLVNSWGHHFDQYGQSFATDGAGGEGINYVVPGAMYFTYAGARRILGSVSPGSYPKFCGLEVLHSEHFPEDWQGNMITCDFRANRVVRFSIAEQGSAYVTTEMPLFVRSPDVSFRPIDVKVGPDGALYIADWSNPIIQHGEVDFRDPRRDHEHGRIWRVAMKGKTALAKPNLREASTRQLLEQLLSPNGFNQQQARRVLTERGPVILPDLKEWLAARSQDAERLQALWIYQALNQIQPALLQDLLASEDGRVRAAATRLLGYWHAQIDDPLGLLAERIQDTHPRVRLEALRALARIPDSRSAALALSAIRLPLDRHLEYALWLTINDLAEPWISAIKAGEWKVSGNERELEYGLTAIEPHLASQVLSQLIKDGVVPADGSGPWIDLISKAGGPAELGVLLHGAASGNFTPENAARALSALTSAARLRNVKPAEDLRRIEPLVQSKDSNIKSAAISLAGAWKQNWAIQPLLEEVGNPALAPEVRKAIFGTLQELGGQSSIEGLRTLSRNEHFLVRKPAVIALAALDLEGSMPLLISTLAEAPNETEALELWRAALGNKRAASLLSGNLSSQSLPVAVGKAGLRAAREGGRNEPDLVLAISRAANLEEEEQLLTPEEMKELASRVGIEGDAHRGEEVYRRLELACVNCHAIGGVGGKIGPDLTSIGASAPVDYIIESVLYPSRKIKEGYHAITLDTEDDQTITGSFLRETDNELVIRDAIGREVSFPKNEIVSRKVSQFSLMPSGLAYGLSSSEQLDLYRFLSELGKPGPFDASKADVARAWSLRAETIDSAQFGDQRVLESDLNEPAWSIAHTQVDGRLLKSEMKSKIQSLAWRDPSAIYAAAQLQLGNAGTINFKLTGGAPMGIWINGEAMSPKSDFQATLVAGIHTVTVKLDARSLPDFIRLQANDGTFLVQ